MKKGIFYLLFAFCNIGNISAYTYWETLTVQVTVNGSSLHCGVYDPTTQAWSYYDQNFSGAYQNNDGYISFKNGSSVYAAVYDVDLHQWKSDWWSSGSSTNSVTNIDGVVSWHTGSSVYATTYDPAVHQWKTDWWSSGSSTNNLTSIDGVVSWHTGSSVYATTYDPAAHQWKTDWWSSGSSTNSLTNIDGVVSWHTGSSVYATTYDPAAHQWKTDWWSSGSSTNNLTSIDGVVSWHTGSSVYVTTYAPASQQWKTDWWSSGSSTSNLINQNRIVAWYSGSSVYVAAYSPTAANWRADYTSASSSSLGSVTISGATVSWNGGAYGWNNNSWSSGFGVPKLAFSATNFSATENRPLIHVRNLSVGANAVYYTFGDGITAYISTGYHLFKVNGQYQRPNNPQTNYTVCIKASGITSSCESLNITVVGTESTAAMSEKRLSCNQIGDKIQIFNLPQSAKYIQVVNVLGQEMGVYNVDNQSALSLETQNWATGCYIITAFDTNNHAIAQNKTLKSN